MAEIVVSRRTFLVGLIVAILAASAISTVISTQWVVGPQGQVGPQGEKGDTGDIGLQGLQGEKGDTGDTGLQGLKGDKGDTGDIGPQGLQGVQGEQGLTGPKGDTGETGPQGPQGEQGEQGPAGVFTIENMSGWLPAPAYDSGWIDVTDYWFTIWHGLNTTATELFVYIIRNDSEYGVNQFTVSGICSPEWLWLSENEITVRLVQIIPPPSYDKVRVRIWKISEP